MSTENFEGRCVIVHRNFQGKQKLKKEGITKTLRVILHIGHFAHLENCLEMKKRLA